jgi:hypothetical protein
MDNTFELSIVEPIIFINTNNGMVFVMKAVGGTKPLSAICIHVHLRTHSQVSASPASSNSPWSGLKAVDKGSNSP